MIKLNIKHTKINASCLETLVEGNVNSIFIEFTFSSEWNELSKIAVFSNGTSKVSVLLSEDTCAIPWEMLACPGELFVAVRGVGNGGNLILCTENVSLGTVTESLADDDSDTPSERSPGIFDTLIANANERIANCKSAYELAVDNGFVGTEIQWLESLHGADGANGIDGTNGVDGIDGADGSDGYTPVKGVDYWTTADIAEIDSHTDSRVNTLMGSYASNEDLRTHTGDTTSHITAAERQTWSGKQDSISDLSSIRSGADEGHSAYTMLSGVEALLASI